MTRCWPRIEADEVGLRAQCQRRGPLVAPLFTADESLVRALSQTVPEVRSLRMPSR